MKPSRNILAQSLFFVFYHRYILPVGTCCFFLGSNSLTNYLQHIWEGAFHFEIWYVFMIRTRHEGFGVISTQPKMNYILLFYKVCEAVGRWRAMRSSDCLHHRNTDPRWNQLSAPTRTDSSSPAVGWEGKLHRQSMTSSSTMTTLVIKMTEGIMCYIYKSQQS